MGQIRPPLPRASMPPRPRLPSKRGLSQYGPRRLPRHGASRPLSSKSFRTHPGPWDFIEIPRTGDLVTRPPADTR